MYVKIEKTPPNPLQQKDIFYSLASSKCCKRGVRNMSSGTPLDIQENVLIERLTFINNEIVKLENERAVLIRHLDLVRKGNVDLRDVKRISSVERAVVEKIILEIISSAHGPIKTKAIEINLMAKYQGVKPPTFRSHLKRMEGKGLIKSHKHGYWIAVKKGKILSKDKSQPPSAGSAA